jgi:hypothetical protein
MATSSPFILAQPGPEKQFFTIEGFVFEVSTRAFSNVWKTSRPFFQSAKGGQVSGKIAFGLPVRSTRARRIRRLVQQGLSL